MLAILVIVLCRSKVVVCRRLLDYDATGNLLGIDIDNASRKVDLKKLTLNKLPAVIQNNSASCEFVDQNGNSDYS